MKISYINSACLQIETSGKVILTDPWFTDGAFNGSWHKIKDIDPFAYVKDPDIVYISHIHPDHYDPKFLRSLKRRYSEFITLIPNSKNNYLERKAYRDGILVDPISYKEIDGLHIHIIENDTGSISDIDSALYIYDENTDIAFLNLNDCIFNNTHVKKIKTISANYSSRIDFMAAGYSGASSYPQRYFDINSEKNILLNEAHMKSKITLDRYKKYVNTFKASINLPFAGEYLLGGKLQKYNEYRGIPDAIETKAIDKNTIVLNHGGSIDLITGKILSERKKPYSKKMLTKRLKDISLKKLDYEKHFKMPYEEINFDLMIRKSLNNALRKSEVIGNFFIMITTLANDNEIENFLVKVHRQEFIKVINQDQVPKKDIIRIRIDYRLLFGLLSGLYHWNNVDLGSQFETRRPKKDKFKYERQNFLNFFSI